MAAINATPTEAQRPEEQGDAMIQKSKEFLIAALRWSFAVLGAKDLLINMQVPFIVIAIALITLFAISSQTTRSNHRTTFINSAFLLQGCLIVGLAIYSIIQNPYIKWVIYVMFLAMVAINPDYQQVFWEMIQIFRSEYEATSSRLKHFIQSQPIIQNLLNINVASREEPSVNNNSTTQPVGGNGSRVRVNNV